MPDFNTAFAPTALVTPNAHDAALIGTVAMAVFVCSAASCCAVAHSCRVVIQRFLIRRHRRRRLALVFQSSPPVAARPHAQWHEGPVCGWW